MLKLKKGVKLKSGVTIKPKSSPKKYPSQKTKKA